MKRTAAIFLRVILFAAVMESGIRASENLDVDASTFRVTTGALDGEFVICLPLDWKSVHDGWKYLIRYAHIETDEQLRFTLMLVRDHREFVLALHDWTNGVAGFDEMSQNEKLAIAQRKKRIPSDFAQILYEAWVTALVSAKFGEGSHTSVGEDFVYVSAYGWETGYMSASVSDYQEGKTTGRIAEIGILLKAYLEEERSTQQEQLETKIRRLATNFVAGKKDKGANR